jgi:hypothetical protein
MRQGPFGEAAHRGWLARASRAGRPPDVKRLMAWMRWSSALAGHVDPQVVGVAHEPVAVSLQLCVEVVQHDVGQQR